MIPDQLKIHPGQEALTPEQEAEAQRFAEVWTQAQSSTEPVDEPEAEAFLRQAYAAAGLAPPQRIHWLDGPLQLVALLASSSMGASVRDSVVYSVGVDVGKSVRASVGDSIWDGVGPLVWESIGDSVLAHVVDIVWNSVDTSVGESVGESVRASVEESVSASVGESVWAYDNAPWLACYQFFDTYFAPNALHALAHFNQLVSGYWLGQDRAVLVRRPARFSRDSLGLLHSATGKCIEYRDGWGFYAWHGVRVPEQVILDPDLLTREDSLKESNAEVRRVIQERMGSRFRRKWEEPSSPELRGMQKDE